MMKTAMLAGSVASFHRRPHGRVQSLRQPAGRCTTAAMATTPTRSSSRLRLKGSAIRRVLTAPNCESKVPALLRALGDQPLPLDCLPAGESEQGLTREQDA